MTKNLSFNINEGILYYMYNKEKGMKNYGLKKPGTTESKNRNKNQGCFNIQRLLFFGLFRTGIEKPGANKNIRNY